MYTHICRYKLKDCLGKYLQCIKKCYICARCKKKHLNMYNNGNRKSTDGRGVNWAYI